MRMGQSKGYSRTKWNDSEKVYPSYSVFGGPNMSIVGLRRLLEQAVMTMGAMLDMVSENGVIGMGIEQCYWD